MFATENAFQRIVFPHLDRLPAGTLGPRRANSAFTFTAALVMGWLGSALAALLTAALLWAIVRLARRDFDMTRSAPATIVAAAGLAFFLGAAAMNIFHYDGGANLHMLAQRAPFLAFLPLVSRYALSGPVQTRAALENGAVLGAAIAAAIALWQIGQGEIRAYGVAGNPGPFALASLAVFIIVLGAALRRPAHASIPYYAGTVLAVMAVLAAGMRVFWLILPLAAAMVILGERKPTLRLLATGVALVAVAVGLSWLAFGPVIAYRLDLMVAEFRTYGDAPMANSSLGEHVAFWSCALQAIGQSPVTGLGEAGARNFVMDCVAAKIGGPVLATHFHNFVLNALAKGGPYELAAIVAMLAAPLVASTMAAHGPTASTGVTVLRVTPVVYGLSGLVGIMFGHDIQDAIFIFLVIVGLHLTSDSALPAGRPPE